MDKDLEDALEMLESLHAAVWTHFDPGMDRGDKGQPEDIKKALTAARKFCRSKGKVFDGWQH